MPYLYGLLLLIFIVLDLKHRDRLRVRSLASALAPAACTGLALTVLLVAAFGWIPVISSLLPLTGARNYRVLHYGWGELGKLLYLPGLRLGYYLGTPVTFWVCATFYLAASAFVVGWRVVRKKMSHYEIVYALLQVEPCHIANVRRRLLSCNFYRYAIRNEYSRNRISHHELAGPEFKTTQDVYLKGTISASMSVLALLVDRRRYPIKARLACIEMMTISSPQLTDSHCLPNAVPQFSGVPTPSRCTARSSACCRRQ